MSVVSGLEWETCRAVLEEGAPGAVAQAIKDADTFFGIELPALTQWAFGPEQAAAIHCHVQSVLGSPDESRTERNTCASAACFVSGAPGG